MSLMKVRITAALLSISVLLCLAVSCAGADNGTTDSLTTTLADENFDELKTADKEQSRQNYKDSLPQNLDFKGKEVTVSVLDHDYYRVDWMAESETGDIVNDALFRRNLTVSDRLNIDLNVISLYNTEAAGANACVASILAGDNAFDIMNVTAACFMNIVTQNVLSDLHKVPYIDLSKPWWNKTSLEVASFYGKSYVITGEIAFRYISGIAVIVFNKALEDAYGLDIYQDYFNGEWTLERLHQYSADAYSDLDGDSVRNNGDRFGFASDTIACADAYYMPLGIQITEIKNGIPVLTLNNERSSSALTDLHRFYWENQGTLILKDGVQTDGHYTLFKNGQALFNGAQLGNLYTTLRETDVEFGIVSYPKYYENQDVYHSHNRNGYSLYAVPVTCGDVDAAGAVLEAAAAENYRIVMPIYFDTSLKIKYSRDNETAQVLDIILAGVKCDFSFFTDIMYFNRSVLGASAFNFASLYASQESKYSAIISNAMKSFE